MAAGDIAKLGVDIEARLEKLEKGLKAALSKTKDAARRRASQPVWFGSPCWASA